jgi:hypothetical protein
MFMYSTIGGNIINFYYLLFQIPGDTSILYPVSTTTTAAVLNGSSGAFTPPETQ